MHRSSGLLNGLHQRPVPQLLTTLTAPWRSLGSWASATQATDHHRCRISRLQTRAAADTAEKAEPAAEKAPELASAEPEDAAKLDLRVGKIISVEPHPEADSLYVEQIDVGEEEPRTIISGLVKYVPQAQMQGRSVVVICNLKPRKMRGIASNGMVLCASNEDHTQVEPLSPPQDATPGQRIQFGDFGEEGPPEPFSPNQMQKKKVFERVQMDLKTTADKTAVWKDLPMVTEAGAVTVETLANGTIS
ncbi:hypothetical protein WJX73_003765 [Symbiochloris irregularis]|uniref:tRNA-binding domain-containing protein n=1 Tax=Symbiochloris irregularis TaxID=706552 RepID=A0AAW1NP42_9CHLO